MKLTRLIFSLTTLACLTTLALSAQTPAPRMLCMFFDLNTMDAAAQSRAIGSAVKFVQQQAAPSDRIAIMTYSAQLNVLQDFTDSRDGVLAALQTIMPGSSAAGGSGNPLQAIQSAISVLASLPDRKVVMYFSSGIPRNGIDDQEELRATTNAALRANVTIYPVDARWLSLPPQ
jgi:VWFA-related protein